MNFTELQMELRSIEEHISQLHNEIEKMKPKEEEEKKKDYETISRLARKHPMKNEKLIKAEPDVKKLFISGLSYMLSTEQTDIYESLLYLTRLAIGCGLDMTAEEIRGSGLAFEEADIDELCKSLNNYKYTYLVESFISANLSEEATVNMLSVIADIARAMGCDKEEVRVTAQVAKAKLIGNMDILKELPLLSKNRWSNQFADYISHDWVVKQRIWCGMVSMSTYEYDSRDQERYANHKKLWGYIVKQSEITRRPKAGSIVRKGDPVCVYTEKVETKTRTQTSYISFSLMSIINEENDSPHNKEEKIITAPCDGIVFFIEDKITSKVENKNDEFVDIYIVSYFDEYNDFCKWYRNGCK